MDSSLFRRKTCFYLVSFQLKLTLEALQHNKFANNCNYNLHTITIFMHFLAQYYVRIPLNIFTIVHDLLTNTFLCLHNQLHIFSDVVNLLSSAPGTRGLHWVSRGSGRFYLCCGREWAVRNFAGDPRGTVGFGVQRTKLRRILRRLFT